MIAQGLHLDLEQLRATLRRYRISPGYQPIPIKQDITADEQAFIEAHRNELPELETIDEERRLYPRDGFAAHLVGYVGEVSEDDLNKPRYAYYQPGDVVGKGGVEETYDQMSAGRGWVAGCDCRQPRARSGRPGDSARQARAGPEAHHRPRSAAGGGDCPGREQRRRLSPWIRATARFWRWCRIPASTPMRLRCASTATSGTS